MDTKPKKMLHLSYYEALMRPKRALKMSSAKDILTNESVVANSVDKGQTALTEVV